MILENHFNLFLSIEEKEILVNIKRFNIVATYIQMSI